METYFCTSSSSSSSSIMSCFRGEKIRELCCSAISKFVSKVLYVISIFVCVVAGATFGVILGALVGVRTKAGCLYGATVGAVKCSLFFLRLFKLLFSLWGTSDDIATRHLFQWVVASYPRNNAESSKKVNGFSTMASLQKIEKIRITKKNILDESGNRISCSICLQDFLLGEKANCLTQCRHMFHQGCIDRWLTGKRSCPLCRQNL